MILSNVCTNSPASVYCDTIIRVGDILEAVLSVVGWRDALIERFLKEMAIFAATFKAPSICDFAFLATERLEESEVTSQATLVSRIELFRSLIEKRRAQNAATKFGLAQIKRCYVYLDFFALVLAFSHLGGLVMASKYASFPPNVGSRLSKLNFFGFSSSDSSSESRLVKSSPNT